MCITFLKHSYQTHTHTHTPEKTWVLINLILAILCNIYAYKFITFILHICKILSIVPSVRLGKNMYTHAIIFFPSRHRSLFPLNTEYAELSNSLSKRSEWEK